MFHLDELSAQEKLILQRQFDASRFGQDTSLTAPTKLAVFDFDSTLFLTPSLTFTIWHPSLINALTTEGLWGPGWWRDIRSLELGPQAELESSQWNGFWNEDTVAKARAAIADPKTMSVVLTGRRSQPFQKLIEAMLRSKSLDFDLLGLRPDPESNEAGCWTFCSQRNKVEYHTVESVFKSTMSFKKAFLLNILDRVPSIQTVAMWDDRAKHVTQFDVLLNRLCQDNVIQRGKVTLVPSISPKYDPQWQNRVVRHILSTHHYNLEDPNERGKQESISWGTSDNLHPLVLRQLVLLPSVKAVVLSERTREMLKKIYRRIYRRATARLATQLPSRQKWILDAEQPVYSAHYVLLDRHSPLDFGDSVTITVTGHSKATLSNGMALRVNVESNQTRRQVVDCVLPLWYKPSDHQALKRRRYQWETGLTCERLHGKVGTMKQYGLSS